mgnify:CR=1 FL=1
MKMNDKRTAFILAAGLGTRLKELTLSKPKALVELNQKPLIEITIDNLISQGFNHFVINIHHFGDEIISYFKKRKYDNIIIEFSDESDLLRDTGGGIKHAAPLLQGGHFLIHNVDIVSNLDLNLFYDTHISDPQSPVATLLVSDRETARYLLFDQENRLVGWINKKTGEVKSPFPEILSQRWEALVERYRPLAFGGMHVVSPGIFPLMEGWGEKFSIIDFYVSIAKDHIVRGYEAPAGTILTDVGKLDQIGYTTKE